MSTEEERLDGQLAVLAGNARLYRYDADLERYADMFDRDLQAWQALPVHVQDASGMYRDARAAYRAAVKAGAVPDDHGPTAA